jgi:two-component sensor histidine kinase
LLKKVILAILLFGLLPLFAGGKALSLQHLKSGGGIDSVMADKRWSNADEGFALGYDFGSHWFRMNVKNDSETQKTFYLEFSEPFAHKCDFYVVRNGTVELFKNGLCIPLKKRSVQTCLPTVKIKLKAKEKVEVYVNYESRFTSYGAFRLYGEDEWISSLSLYNSLFMLYFGAVGIMTFYNFFLFVSLRDIAYFYYVGHAFVFAVWVFLYSGLSLNFIDATWHYALHFTTPLAFAFFTLYSVSILRVRECFPFLYRTSLALAALLVAISAIVVLNLEIGYLLANAVGIIFFPFFIFLALLSIRRGIKTAKFYLAALLPYLLTMSVVANLAMGIIEYSSAAKFSFIAGSMIELTLFSLLLAYRIHLLRLEQISTQNTLLELEATKSDELQRTVDEKTIELQRSNKQLEETLSERTLLLNEIHHRVKNNLQLIIALLWMQGGRTDNVYAKTALKESAAKIKSIAAIHQLLYASKNLKSIDMAEYLPQVVKNLLAASINKFVNVKYEIQDIFLDTDRAAALGMIAAEILTNSFKHAVPCDGILHLLIKLEQNGERLNFLISDNGSKEPASLSDGNMGMTLVAQMSSRLKNARYGFRYENGVIFELEFDIE